MQKDIAKEIDRDIICLHVSNDIDTSHALIRYSISQLMQLFAKDNIGKGDD